MKDLAFFDTNILLYTDDRRSPEKREKALQLFSHYRQASLAMVSLQVLQEYYAAATRKLGVEPEVARAKVELLSRIHVVRLSPEDVLDAIDRHRLSRISFWDAMIVHAAKAGGAGVLYSEDLQHDGRLGGVRIVNPFA